MTPQEQSAEKPLAMYQELEEAAAKPAETPTVTDALMERMTAILERLADRQDAGPIPQIPISKAKFQTPWNPTGERYTEELKRPTFMNGRRLAEMTLSQKEIQLINQLKPGKYHDRKWVVIETDGGSEGSALHLFVPDKTQEQRLALKQDARTLVELLEKILDEQRTVRLN